MAFAEFDVNSGLPACEVFLVPANRAEIACVRMNFSLIQFVCFCAY